MSAPVVLTPGDPRGIGPEVAVRALWKLGGPALLLGDVDAVRAVGPLPPDVELRRPAWTGEPVEVAALREAVGLCRARECSALVTGPIHKGRLAAQGFAYTGHTDFLGAIFGVDPVMAFVGGGVRVALVTVHLPIAAVPAALTVERVAHTLHVAHEALVRDLRIPAPRLVVCGLNPHAGEGGLLGREEIEVIGPACAQARVEGLRVLGPVSAETAFLHPDEGDLIVAMYHDQGLVPLKRVDFGRTVNWTMGLPIVRTSVDHGTADELVGTGLARSDSMEAAITLARELAGG